jgi:sporulation protein YabP
MDKIVENVIDNAFGEIKIIDRKKCSLTGIKKLVSFNPEEFLIESSLGILVIKGHNLEVIKLDTVEGNLAIKGIINSFNYMDNNKNQEPSFWAKLFK